MPIGANMSLIGEADPAAIAPGIDCPLPLLSSSPILFGPRLTAGNQPMMLGIFAPVISRLPLPLKLRTVNPIGLVTPTDLPAGRRLELGTPMVPPGVLGVSSNPIQLGWLRPSMFEKTVCRLGTFK